MLGSLIFFLARSVQSSVVPEYGVAMFYHEEGVSRKLKSETDMQGHVG